MQVVEYLSVSRVSTVPAAIQLVLDGRHGLVTMLVGVVVASVAISSLLARQRYLILS